jgi:hypothetical protein
MCIESEAVRLLHVLVVARLAPLGAHVKQVDEEVVSERLGLLGKNSGRRATGVGT